MADKNGFRATIKTNEPGTSDEGICSWQLCYWNIESDHIYWYIDPADVHIESNAPKVSQLLMRWSLKINQMIDYLQTEYHSAPYKSQSYSHPVSHIWLSGWYEMMNN